MPLALTSDIVRSNALAFQRHVASKPDPFAGLFDAPTTPTSGTGAQVGSLSDQDITQQSQASALATPPDLSAGASPAPSTPPPAPAAAAPAPSPTPQITDFGGTGAEPGVATPGAVPGRGRPSQFALDLSSADAYAACGPAAAIGFARAFGRNPTNAEAMDLARQVGWTQAQGMAGVASEQKLLSNMGVPTKLEQNTDWGHVAQDAGNGNPVIISTPGHYFFVDDYRDGKYHVGTSGTDLKGGSEWMTPGEMHQRMGPDSGALYADNPTSPAPSVANRSSDTGVPTTAGLSGGGPSDSRDPRNLLGAAASAASWLGDQGQKALQAVIVTEGGLNNARGDNGSSAGPLQFFGEEGGRGGQLNAYAAYLGVSLAQARDAIEKAPQDAIAWAVGTPEHPGYIGTAIQAGISKGLSGPDLATYAQQHGQVSVSPERAGANWNAMFGPGGTGAPAAGANSFTSGGTYSPTSTSTSTPTQPQQSFPDYVASKPDPFASLGSAYATPSDTAPSPAPSFQDYVASKPDPFKGLFDSTLSDASTPATPDTSSASPDTSSDATALPGASTAMPAAPTVQPVALDPSLNLTMGAMQPGDTTPLTGAADGSPGDTSGNVVTPTPASDFGGSRPPDDRMAEPSVSGPPAPVATAQPDQQPSQTTYGQDARDAVSPLPTSPSMGPSSPSLGPSSPSLGPSSPSMGADAVPAPPQDPIHAFGSQIAQGIAGLIKHLTSPQNPTDANPGALASPASISGGSTPAGTIDPLSGTVPSSAPPLDQALDQGGTGGASLASPASLPFGGRTAADLITEPLRGPNAAPPLSTQEMVQALPSSPDQLPFGGRTAADLITEPIKAAVSPIAKDVFPNIGEPNHPFNVMQEMQDKYGTTRAGLVDQSNMTPEDRQRFLDASLAVGGVVGGAGPNPEGLRAMTGGASDTVPGILGGTASNAARTAGADAGAAAEGLGIPESAGAEAAPEVGPTSRFYHGTGGDFAKPDGAKFDQNGLFGPGYYVTDNPAVASSYGTNAIGSATAIQDELSGLYARKAAGLSDRQGFVVDNRIADLEDQLRSLPSTQGPNVRAVDVPQNLNLLNADAPPPPEVKQILQADYDRMYPQHQPGHGPAGIVHDATLSDLYNYAERGGYGTKETINKALADAGYDGIQYNGGQRSPMQDANGQDITHQAVAIFPSSLDKLRNAISGTQGGASTVGFASGADAAVAAGRTAQDVLAPARNAPEPIQQAINRYDGATRVAPVQIQRYVDRGLLSQSEADRLTGGATANAKSQFITDIAASPDGVLPKTQLAPQPYQFTSTGNPVQLAGSSITPVVRPKGWLDGADIQAGLKDVWVSPETATAVKGVLSQGQSTPILSGIAQGQGQLKQIVLNTPFHGLQEAFQATRLALSQRENPMTLLGPSTLNAVVPGAMKAYLNEPATISALDRALRAGMTFRTGEATDFTKLSGWAPTILRGAVGGATSGGATYLKEKAAGTPEDQARIDAAKAALLGAALTGPIGTKVGEGIFGRQIPTLKLEGFKMLTGNGMSDETAAAMVNQTFGGQNLVRIARSPVVQDIARVALLAPDWWEGFGRNILSAIPGAPVSKEMGNAARAYVATAAISSAISLEGLNLLTTGHFTNQNEAGHELDLEIPHSTVARLPGAPIGEPGQMDHIDILGPVKSMAALATGVGGGLAGMTGLPGTDSSVKPTDAVGTFMHSREGTLPSSLSDFLANKNSANSQPIVPPGASTGDAVKDVAGYEAGKAIPVGSSGPQQAAGVGGPVAGAYEYLTGQRISSETRSQQANKGYYATRDDKVAQLTDWLKQQPEYQRANPAEQKNMIASKTIELEKTLREQAGMQPRDLGLPPKYIGVTDPAKQQQIDDAKAKMNAYLTAARAGSRTAVAPSKAEQNLALSYPSALIDPKYTAAVKARGETNSGLDSRFQQRFVAPSSKP